MNEVSESGVVRDAPELESQVSQFIEDWSKKIKAAKHHFSDDFKRMREDMKIARQGADDKWVKDDLYTVPVINRYINQSVSSLYAKNPTASAERRKTLDFQIWDGTSESIEQAYMTMQNSQMAIAQGDLSQVPAYQQAQALLADVEQGKAKRDMVTKVGKTLEICFNYYSNEQKPKLKPLMKSLVRRAKTCGVGYLMLGFQRQFDELTPDETAKLEDSRNQMAELKRRVQDFNDDEIDSSNEQEIYEIEKLIEQFETKGQTLLREGPLFMFPKATEIIPDPKCTDLMGFAGAGWIVREFHKTAKEIQKIYNVDIKASQTAQSPDSDGSDYYARSEANAYNEDGKTEDLVCVWEVYNKDLGEVFTIAEGYKGFLKECSPPEYYIEGFFPIFAITFNASESEDKLFPLSDVHNLKHVQNEYNRSRESRRLHRQSNVPMYVTFRGKLSDEDLDNLKAPSPFAVIEVDGMNTGEKIEDVVQRFRPVPLDPALYETNSEMEDILRTVGAQEANLGGASGGTATEVSVGESGRMTSLASNVDDLDSFLSEVVEATGQLMLAELSEETVKKIAGVGAVWPSLDKEEISKQLYLKVRAGSAGKPNKAAELANMERAIPYIIQFPNINPIPVVRPYLELLDIDFEEAILKGLPSIVAMNSIMGNRGSSQGAGTENDPNEQGSEGQFNNESPQQNEPGPQPEYPSTNDQIN